MVQVDPAGDSTSSTTVMLDVHYNCWHSRAKLIGNNQHLERVADGRIVLDDESASGGLPICHKGKTVAKLSLIEVKKCIILSLRFNLI